ncbi:hypothetical protein SLEP1_g22577 [Rubroshorea leprosula]|uniref:Uncharacterized protein n=1 Tax=Rubroshorea leprosula TaxID=152421 RepID=A0AAV5JIV7_9ROSI|nr:hypothetical protein SLEP1_g22577 [Rubroshorea leprosula]
MAEFFFLFFLLPYPRACSVLPDSLPTSPPLSHRLPLPLETGKEA